MTLSIDAYHESSFIDQGRSRLRGLCTATGLTAQTEKILESFTRLLAPWGHGPVEREPLWRSDVGDDHTPYEFSVAFGEETELRLLVEPLGGPPSLTSNR